jgi:hypothetical protein
LRFGCWMSPTGTSLSLPQLARKGDQASRQVIQSSHGEAVMLSISPVTYPPVAASARYGRRCKQQFNCLALFHRLTPCYVTDYGLYYIRPTYWPRQALLIRGSIAFYSAPVIYIYLDRGEQMHESMRSSVETGVDMHMCGRSRRRKFNLFRRNVTTHTAIACFPGHQETNQHPFRTNEAHKILPRMKTVLKQ